ncbi:unnamed protein product [Rotaria magnacalcarata]|uniref:Uncharacterized protein n=1 Tax=Rotaria magnacalcarata TaxID=392030 RepID=A0A816LUL4_9BILA|nr:unnamed protein product [Rotaria magnacalcarata]CAF1686518.1 unnamed protein product [Rotaria magnacalcarata]CAF1957188.1 unnamed protein product [Rotaria magnacalcarata]CAF2140763.1 unnamed protein product [Rotaria magnacalcarata]CAF3901568.1 unnamed protein product [Rotaria magnacalcarata]
MITVTKAVSDTNLHRHESKTSVSQLELKSSINSEHVLNSRSGNNIVSKGTVHSSLLQNSTKSNLHNYRRFPNNDLVNTHFPIINMKEDLPINNKVSFCQLPAVPKQAGTFIYRLVNKFFRLKNTNENKEDLFPMKQIKQKRSNTKLNAKLISDNSHTLLNIISRKRQRRQQCSKNTTNNNQHCTVCRKYRNSFSIVPISQIQVLSTDYISESSHIINTNAIVNHRKQRSVLTVEPFISLPRTQLEKIRSLNESQCQTIASAVELIFDSLMSNYQQI